MIMRVYSTTMFILCVTMLQPPTCPNARQCGVNRGESAPEVTVERRLILREHDRQEQDAGGRQRCMAFHLPGGRQSLSAMIRQSLSTL